MQSGSVEGIVLQKTNYGDNGIILKLLTENEGIKSFIFHGAKSKKKKGNLISPLAILNLRYQQKNQNSLPSVQDIDLALILKTTPTEPSKLGVVFFMNEVILQVTTDQEDNSDLFNFVRTALRILDSASNISNFPIKFLLHLTNQLGLGPNVEVDAKYFDLKEAAFVKHQPAHPVYIDKERTALILLLFHTALEAEDDLKISLEMRRKILEDVLNYYKMVQDGFKNLKCLEILELTFH